MSLDDDGKEGEISFESKGGINLIWIRGWRQMMDKLWEDCLPKLWALQKMLAHKRSVATNQALLEKQCLQAHEPPTCSHA